MTQVMNVSGHLPSICLSPEAKKCSGVAGASKINTEKDLHRYKTRNTPPHRYDIRPFCCFRTGEIFYYIADSDQFNTTDISTGVVRKFELLTGEWLASLHSVVLRSIDNPKSVELLLQSVDLYRRALFVFLSAGNACPDFVSPGEAASTLADEKLAAIVATELYSAQKTHG